METIKDKPAVRLKPSSYQPSKAEMEEDIGIDTTPEDLLRAVVCDVRIEYDEKCLIGVVVTLVYKPRLKGPPALLQHALGSIVMDVVRGEHGDPAMAMFGVVPREERSAEGDRGGDVVEAAREAGVVLQGLELGLGEGVVVGHLRAAQ